MPAARCCAARASDKSLASRRPGDGLKRLPFMRNFSAPLLIALGVLAHSAPAVAANDIDCSDPKTTVEMNVCADAAFKEADKRLNALYKDALAYIESSDLEAPYDRKSWEEAMRASQRAWVAFRDADCTGLVPMEWSGGTGTSSAVMGCMTEKTEARINELKERYGSK
jgi:uncharacterized protein YecT (DUF1311 family)